MRYGLLWLFLITVGGLHAQPVLEQDTINNMPVKIDRYLNSALDAYKFNGVALVAKNGKIIFHKAYGWKNIETKTSNDTSTKFPILSITKSFTAMVMLKLQEQNKLQLKDRLSKYLPDFPNGDKITIEQLLTHTSGLHNFSDDIGEEDSGIVNHPVPQKQILDIINSKPLSYKPGTSFEYNNSGYYVAGLVIEKVTGISYWQNVRELIFSPVGMNNSGFDFNGLPEKERATGYQFLNADQHKQYGFLDSTVGYSAGSIYSTTGDLFKWTMAIANKSIVSSKSWRYMLSPKTGDYGTGFRLNSFFGRQYIKHSGGYPGYASEFIYYPKDEITIILLRNTGTYGQDLWPVTMGMSCILFGLPYDHWVNRPEIKLSESQLALHTGSYQAGKVKISILVKQGQLLLVIPDGSELPLLAETEHQFYLENYNTTLHFENAGGEQGSSLIIHEHGKDELFKKLLKQ